MAFVRDAGGLEADRGRFRRGLLYRFSGDLLTQADFDTLREAEVRVVVDLRSQSEDREALQRWAESQRVHYEHAPLDVAQPDLLAAWGSGLTPEEARRWLRDIYRYLIDHHGPTLAAAIAAVSQRLPAAFGCAAGKDRTGLVAALIQRVVGADSSDIAGRFASDAPSPDALRPIVRRRRGKTALSPGSRTVLSAPAEAMAATLDYIDGKFGGVVPYLTGCGLDPESVSTLRHKVVAQRTGT